VINTQQTCKNGRKLMFFIKKIKFFLQI
jgi:hypothetical protein